MNQNWNQNRPPAPPYAQPQNQQQTQPYPQPQNPYQQQTQPYQQPYPPDPFAGSGGDPFTGLESAEIFDQGQWFQPGLYVVQINRCLLKTSQKSGLGFIAECQILASNQPANPAGTTASWWQTMGGRIHQGTAFSSLKEFIAAACGFDPKTDKDAIHGQLDPQIRDIARRAVSPENILGGRYVCLETFTKKTKQRGVDFTVHRWTPYRGTMPTSDEADYG